MKYQARPVIVDAWVISRVQPKEGGGFQLERDGMVGADFDATPEMCARYTPKEGDYIVRQSDGYVYLNPKDVFERKYGPAELIAMGLGKTVQQAGLMALLFCFLTCFASAAFAQTAVTAPAPAVAPITQAWSETAAPTIPVQTFSLTASPISLPGIGTTVAGAESGFTFHPTTNNVLLEDNITAAGFQFYGGGFTRLLPTLSVNLNNVSPTLNGMQFQFGVTASVGVDRITSTPTTQQHYAFLAGGLLNYRLSPTSAWALAVKVRYAKLPGYNNNTFVVSVGPSFNF